MTDADRAREVLADAYERAGYPDEASAFRAGEWTCHDHPALAAMRTAIAQAHAAGLEEAAKVADAYAKEAWGITEEETAAQIIATAIRARITTTGGGE